MKELEIRECAASWEPGARLLGDVTAGEIVGVCDELIRLRGVVAREAMAAVVADVSSQKAYELTRELREAKKVLFEVRRAWAEQIADLAPRVGLRALEGVPEEVREELGRVSQEKKAEGKTMYCVVLADVKGLPAYEASRSRAVETAPGLTEVCHLVEAEDSSDALVVASEAVHDMLWKTMQGEPQSWRVLMVSTFVQLRSVPASVLPFLIRRMGGGDHGE